MENYFSKNKMFYILNAISESFIFIFLFLIFSYLIGSIPFGLIFAKIFNVGDIRKIGSGNIGATNVLRSGSKIAAFLTLLCDGFKGAFIIQISLFSESSTIALFCGFLCFLGHLYPIFLFFKGGKGVATFFGILISIDLLLGILVCLTWIIVILLTKISSLSALLSSILCIVISIYFFERNDVYFIILFVFLIWLKHFSNIKRLLNGTEPKVKI